MDPSRFDHLTRLLGRAGGRRGVVGALLGALLGPAATKAAKKRRKSRDNDRDRDRDTGRDEDREREQRLQAERRKDGKRRKRKNKKKRGGSGGGQMAPPPPDCCGTKSCPNPERGSTSSQCDFASRSFAGQDLNGSIFRGIDGRNANFANTDNRGSIFAEACLQGARFRNADLDGSTWEDACVFGADFAGADLDADDPVFAEARFCKTRMPDGSLNDRDCGRETTCCRRGDEEPGPACRPDGGACAQDSDCCGGNCFGEICADRPEYCGNATCPGNAVGCCQDTCCTAPANQCNPGGLCCAPNCAGKACGADGCGGDGTCGSCPDGLACNGAGQCVCTPQSCRDGCCDGDNCRPGTTNQACGTDGAPCASCPAGQSCQGQRCAACTPRCAGRQCGPDGCGGQCGECDGLLCDEQTGQCLCAAQVCPGCCSNGPGNPGVCRVNQANTCGANGQPCVSCPAPGVCTAQGQCVCTPNCAGKACGSDGCGGSCGTCPPGEICDDPFPGQCACLADGCPTGLQCCPAGDADRCLRPDGEVCGQPGDCCSGACCGGVCCDQPCCGETCCAPGRTCCGTICCPDGQHCCGGACCPSDRQCCDHGVCCDDDSECRGGVCTECEPSCTCFGQDGCSPDAGLNQFCGAGGAGNPCFCVVSRTGQPLCAGTAVDSPTCTTDADCQGFGAGSVCVNAAPAGSECPTWGNFCAIPCAQPGATSAPFRGRAKEEAHAPAVTTPGADASLSARASGRAAVDRAIVRSPDA